MAPSSNYSPYQSCSIDATGTHVFAHYKEGPQGARISFVESARGMPLLYGISWIYVCRGLPVRSLDGVQEEVATK